MTEQEWLTTKNLQAMLTLLKDEFVVECLCDERKFRLFANACCRLLWHQLSEGERQAVRASDRFVEGLRNELTMACATPIPYLPNFIAIFAFVFQREDVVRVTVAFNESESHTTEAANHLRDIFGNPFRPVSGDPAWLTSTVVSLATAIYDERAFDRLPILADALEDAGCTNEEILKHCRQPGEHVRGCWAVDLVLDKQ